MVKLKSVGKVRRITEMNWNSNLILATRKFAKHVIRGRRRKSKTLFNIVKIFSSKSVKIAGEGLNIEKEPNQAPEGNQGVEAVRRLHTQEGPEACLRVVGGARAPQPKGEPLARKNSLTHKFDVFKREKGCDEKRDKAKQQTSKQPLVKQKSIGPESTAKSELFKALSFKDKSKSVSVKHVDTLVAPKSGDTPLKGVRKSDKRDSDKTPKSSISLCRSKSSAAKNKEGLKQDDFLKATMRIFLVVSPPTGKVQGWLKPPST
ncbi:hypothetical protein NQ318_017840 [Aromia moschata]|uniref:Uncharacterized protein n=1 Tax=Aromia moschata TaxID=1265417 RepID=A0AAV8YGC4_9CUCU|nr:hypothetical protein NQ318_017840 [Aromia moschata]